MPFFLYNNIFISGTYNRLHVKLLDLKTNIFTLECKSLEGNSQNLLITGQKCVTPSNVTITDVNSFLNLVLVI